MENQTNTGDLTTIKGLVIPVAWDEEGNVHHVSIFGVHEEQYLVELDAKGKELLALTRAKLKIRGLIRELVKGEKIIQVKSYSLVANFHS